MRCENQSCRSIFGSETELARHLKVIHQLRRTIHQCTFKTETGIRCGQVFASKVKYQLKFSLTSVFSLLNVILVADSAEQAQE